MERFAALVDALVYTRSRNEKLRLIADYLHDHARSRPRLGARGADRGAELSRGQAGARSAG